MVCFFFGPKNESSAAEGNHAGTINPGAEFAGEKIITITITITIYYYASTTGERSLVVLGHTCNA
jgi:hypothetical protein